MEWWSTRWLNSAGRMVAAIHAAVVHMESLAVSSRSSAQVAAGA